MARVTLGFSRATRTRTPENPYPCPGVRVSTGTGTGFAKTRGYATRERVCLQNRLRNLATAVQVSIDTAVQRCEVSSLVVAGWHDPSGHRVPRSWALIVGVLVGRTCLAWPREHSQGEWGWKGCASSLVCWWVELAWLGSGSIREGEWGWKGRASCSWVGGLTRSSFSWAAAAFAFVIDVGWNFPGSS